MPWRLQSQEDGGDGVWGCVGVCVGGRHDTPASLFRNTSHRDPLRTLRDYWGWGPGQVGLNLGLTPVCGLE